MIDQFTYSTYEQAIHGIDLSQTVAKIKLILKQQQLNLRQSYICHNRNMGVLLDTYFQKHTHINLDLLVNALILHYQISPEVDELVA